MGCGRCGSDGGKFRGATVCGPREREDANSASFCVLKNVFFFFLSEDFIIILFSDVRILFRLIARLFSRGWRVLFYPKDLSTEIKCMAMHRDSRVDA